MIRHICRMSYRCHTLRNIITRYFVLVTIPKSPAYKTCGALHLIQEEQGERRTSLYLVGFSVASLLLDSAALPQLPARAALVYPPRQNLLDTLSPRVASYHSYGPGSDSSSARGIADPPRFSPLQDLYAWRKRVEEFGRLDIRWGVQGRRQALQNRYRDTWSSLLRSSFASCSAVYRRSCTGEQAHRLQAR